MEALTRAAHRRCCHTVASGMQISTLGACGDYQSWSCRLLCSAVSPVVLGSKIYVGRGFILTVKIVKIQLSDQSRSSGEHTWLGASGMHVCHCQGQLLAWLQWWGSAPLLEPAMHVHTAMCSHPVVKARAGGRAEGGHDCTHNGYTFAK